MPLGTGRQPLGTGVIGWSVAIGNYSIDQPITPLPSGWRPQSDVPTLRKKRAPGGRAEDSLLHAMANAVRYALFKEPNCSMSSFVRSTIASRPGLSTLRGSYPLPCVSLPAAK